MDKYWETKQKDIYHTKLHQFHDIYTLDLNLEVANIIVCLPRGKTAKTEEKRAKCKILNSCWFSFQKKSKAPTAGI